MTTSTEKRGYTLDPVTFEVLKNAFVTIVDQMAEQILRTCHSFVIYARDFSSALCDRDGNTVMQGSQDIAVHVGTLHFTARRSSRRSATTSTRATCSRSTTPTSAARTSTTCASCGRSSTTARSSPSRSPTATGPTSAAACRARSTSPRRSTSARASASRRCASGTEGRYLDDVVRLIVSNTRVPADAEGDLHAQAAATRVAEREILRLVDKYGIDTIADRVPGGAGLRRAADAAARRGAARRQLGDRGLHRLRPVRGRGADPGQGQDDDRGRPALATTSPGSHPAIGSLHQRRLRLGRSRASIAGTKTFFPDVPLNSGFYRAVEVDLGPAGSVVNAPWPIAVTGFCAGPYEKIMNSIFELWSELMPERAMACSFNLEYLLVGGRDARHDEPADLHVVRLDGRRLGRPQRQGRLERDRADLRRRASPSSRSRRRSASARC